jgi:hypothetical protein
MPEFSVIEAKDAPKPKDKIYRVTRYGTLLMVRVPTTL